MDLAARKSDVKNHVSRHRREKTVTSQATNSSDGTNTKISGTPHAGEASIPKPDTGRGFSEIGDPWTVAEMKLLSP